jgi:mannosyltransferase OCH1-like enzyme
MIPRNIHQVFGVFDDGKKLEDFPIFVSQQKKTMKHCKEFGLPYKLWLKKDCDKLLNDVYPQYKEFYHSMRYGVQKADFIRYLILYEYGGLYIDLDIAPLRNLNVAFTSDVFFVKWEEDTRNLPYNAVLGSIPKHRIFKEILEHCIESYREKEDMEIYNQWTGRFVFQTTGHFMLQRVLAKHPFVGRWSVLRIHKKDGTIEEGDFVLFEDFNISSWYESDD